MVRTFAATGFVVPMLIGAGAALAEPKDGTTLAGGNNGADAKADSTMKAGGGMENKGSPAAPVAPGQSTEHPDGKMRAQKNF